MKTFSTPDLEASVRRAHADFTHVAVDRTYSSLKPSFMRTGNLVDLPIYLWAPWLNRDTPKQRWQKEGGVLICQGGVETIEANDVLLFAECPFSLDVLRYKTANTVEYVVLPIPNWRVYEEAIDIKHPPAEEAERLQRALWKFGTCEHPALTHLGQRSGYVCMDTELAEEMRLPHTRLQYMYGSFKPVTVYQVQKRLAPEGPLAEVYSQVPEIIEKKLLTLDQRKALKEMDRLGHIRLTKYRVFPNRLLNLKRHTRNRERALTDLAAIRSLVESLPGHLQT